MNGRGPVRAPGPRLSPAPVRRRPGIGAVWALILVLIVMTGLLIGRLAQWQVVEGPIAGDPLPPEAREVTTPAVRGQILAADGTPMVTNVPSTVVTLDPSVLLTAPDEGRVMIAAVARELDLPERELWGRTRLCGTPDAPPVPSCFSSSPYQPIPLAYDVDPVAALALAERPEDYPGIALATVPVRDHPDGGPTLTPAAGYLGRVTEAEITDAANEGRLLTSDELIGRSGLEQQYDVALRGEPAVTIVEIDPRGVVVSTGEHQPAVPGLDLVTHLDIDVQAAAEQALADAVASARQDGYPATSAAAVVVEVNSGAVIASASLPSYDPGVWVGGIDTQQYAALADPAHGAPLVDRVSAGTFPPASTFKVISLPAALRHGVDPDIDHDCPGSITIGGQTFSNFNSEDHGEIDLQRIMEVSCDTTFYRWSSEHWDAIGGLGQTSDVRDPYILLAQDFGLGALTGIDLPGEEPGLIPTREWKVDYWEATREATCARAESGYPEIEDSDRRAFLEQLAEENCIDGWQYRAGDAVNLSIGQGDVAATPLQMAVAYAALANGGTRWQPQIGAELRTGDGQVVEAFEPVQIGTLGLTGEELAVVRAGLEGVNLDGTGADAFTGFDLANYPIAGKTGSAESFGQIATGWYASYGPVTDPEYAVVVVVEHGGLGGEIAAPAARAIWEVLADTRP